MNFNFFKKKPIKSKFKILIISDTPTFKNYPLQIIKEKTRDVDFILAAGDLSNDYLDFMLSSTDKELIYVNGNHTYNSEHEISFCKNIDQKIIYYKGLKIMGFDGSPVYSSQNHQYTESDIKRTIFLNIFSLIKKKPDIVLSHTPPYGIHDLDDHIHTGFKSFHIILNHFKPKIWIHGHIHLENHHKIQETFYKGTKIINAYGYKIIEFEV